MLPTLVQAEWSVPIKQYVDLDNTGGVSVAQRDAVPEVLRAIGYTVAPVAILTTQTPQALGLKGYLFENITCTVRVKEDDGAEKEITIKRCLIQHACRG